jgi:nucleotide-binding universal stress UspA family protein
MSGVFRRIVVPVEFEAAEPGEIALGRAVEVGDHGWVAVGPYTIRALELAARLASGGEVCIVHATRDFMDNAGWMSPPRIAELDGDLTRDSTTVLEAIVRRHCFGVTLRYVIAPGKALDLILDAARSRAADAIVLAASARRRVNRAILGSTADKVIRQSSCPVVVVPSGTA